MEYLISLILVGIVTAVLLNRVKIDITQLLKALVPLFIFGVVWDYVGTTLGWWSFNSEKMLGVKLGILPLEEYLFMLIIPLFIIAVYENGTIPKKVDS